MSEKLDNDNITNEYTSHKKELKIVMPDLDALKNTPDFSNLQKLDFSNIEKSTGERLKESGSTPNTGRTGQMS